MDCIFCKIAKGEIPSAKIYEDKDFLAILDINPANKGHTLLITKKHRETLLDIDTAMLKKLMVTAQKLARNMADKLAPDGFNLFVNNGKAAGQVIPHLHVHIVPRYKDDGLEFNWPHKKYEEGELQEFAAKLKDSPGS
jgi:histidine triad (HIT) family protein